MCVIGGGCVGGGIWLNWVGLERSSSLPQSGWEAHVALTVKHSVSLIEGVKKIFSQNYLQFLYLESGPSCKKIIDIVNK